MNTPDPEDTIAAISTPLGEGGIGIVRLSGSASISIARQVFVSSSGLDIESDRRRVFHGEIHDENGVLDEVLLHVMRAPHSYTREDVVEINCHGGPAPLKAILELLMLKDARLAEPGEFTRRAYMNGRIDLIQAEAVIDRIRARTRSGLKAAAAASRGALSKEIHGIRDLLADVKGYIEAAIDFPDQDVPDFVTPELQQKVENVRDRMATLLETADAGRLHREGTAVGIAGGANVGKSSLFNALLRDTRAIVTEHAGTTRDLLEEVVAIEGLPVRLIDMAGLREVSEEVERIGIDRAREALQEVAAVLLVLDSSLPFVPEDENLAKELADDETPVLLVMNKIDLGTELVAPAWHDLCTCTVHVSAKNGEGLATLEAALAKLLLGGAALAPDSGMVTRLHQKDSLRRALDAIERLLADFGASPEFLSLELEDALRALGEITGETTPDEVLDRIFSSFCIGK